MLDAFRKLFSGPDVAERKEAGEELMISIAALMVEAAVADEHYTADERALIGRLLVREFGVDESDTPAILAKGEARQKASVDLYRFIRDAKALSPAERVTLVESLWRVILSDGAKHSFEDMLVRRVCGLLHVGDVESGLARQRVQQELGL